MRYRSTRVASGLDDTGRDCHSCNGENLKFYLERDTDNSIHTLVDFCYITTHLIDFSSFKMSVSKKVRLLYTVSFLDLFACSMVVPLLSVHLRSLGASHFTIGIMSSLYAGLQLLSSPVIGSWSDIRGHHYVLQFTLIICSILYFVLGASSAISVIMLTRIGLGFLKHTQTLCRTLLTDVVSLKDQLHVQGQIVSYGSVGFILGPAIGGHMAESNNGFYYICCIVMLSYWINFGIVNLFLSDVHEAKHG